MKKYLFFNVAFAYTSTYEQMNRVSYEALIESIRQADLKKIRLILSCQICQHLRL